jgi:signal transduction histidine kinase
MNTALLERDGTPGLVEGSVSTHAVSDADLLAHMIHDIKNPLSAIMCYAEIVSEAQDGERREYCDRLQANARAVLDLLDGFGLLVALRGNEAETMLESFDWVRQAMRVVGDLQSVAAFRSQRVACDSAGDRFVSGDRSKLTVALRSLLLEGLRVAAPGATVALHVRASGDEAVVEVVVPAEVEAVGVPLFDLQRPTLELVARVADLHHGRLAFRFEGREAVATFRIPLG